LPRRRGTPPVGEGSLVGLTVDRSLPGVFVTAAALRVPVVSVVLRRGFGLGAMAFTAGHFHAPMATAAWPQAEFGPMGLEGAVRLGFRKELAAAREGPERDALFEKLLGVKAHVQAVASQKVTEARFAIGGGTEINLVAPADPSSTIAGFIEKRGEGLHHVALEVDDVDAALGAMEAQGVRLIDRSGREGAAGQIGFLHPKSVNGVLVELVEPRDAEK